MIRENESRQEDRVNFVWPLWFGYEDNGELFCGKAVDVSRTHVSFTVEDNICPPLGHHLVTRFSFPRKSNDGFEMDSYLHWSEVIRIDHTNTNQKRVAMRLHQPLSYNPSKPKAEQEALFQTT